MTLIIRKPATNEQISQMAEIYDGVLIKLAVDVEREILAGGGVIHIDCEQALLDDGSYQMDVWGVDWYPRLKRIGFESLTNIRSHQKNFSFELQHPALRVQIETIIRSLLEGS